MNGLKAVGLRLRLKSIQRLEPSSRFMSRAAGHSVQ